MNLKKAWTSIVNWLIDRPKRTSYLVLFVCLIISYFIISLRYEVSHKIHDREMSAILHTIHKNIEQTLKASYTSTLTLAMTLNHHGEVEHFQTVASQIIQSNPDISAVQLVPDGVIKYIYPIEGNEEALNYNLYGNPNLKEEIQKSITLNNMYFAGPLQLRQGGIGIVGRYPIYLKKKLWGFSAVVIKLDTLLKNAGVNEIDSSKFYFQFGKINPNTKEEEFFMPNKEDFSEKHFSEVSFPDGDWKIYLISKDENYLVADLLPLLILCLALSTLLSITIGLILKKPSELLSLARKQKKKLIKSETRYQSIFSQAAVGIAKINFITNQYVEVNEPYCQFFGYTLEELKNKNYKEITHPDDLSHTMSSLQKLISGEISKIVAEKRYIKKNGEVVWGRVTVSPLWSQGETPKTVISVVEDITATKKAEEAIKKSEEEYRSLFDDSPIALWEEDLSEVKKYLEDLGLMGKDKSMVSDFLNANPKIVDKCISLIRIINVNTESLVLHNVESKEELIANFPEIIKHGTFEAIIKILIGVTQKEQKGRIEGKIVFPNGTTKYISLTWNIVKGYEDSLERIIISTEDITERKASQKVIVASQKRIESLINTIDGIVWECDAVTFKFSFISKKVENILGYTVEEWMESPNFWVDHIYPEDRDWTIDYCTNQTVQLKQHDFEYRMIAKDGRIVWLRDIVNVITESDGSVNLRGIMIDITQSKDIEIELNNSFSLVTEQNKRLLNFSYIISHNLRSHTSNLQSLSTLLKNAESDKEREELLPLLSSVSEALNETMHNLNEVVNIQTNVNLNVEPLNLRRCIDKTLHDLSIEIEQRNITINCKVQEDTLVVYNPAYLENILINCISNAIRYSDPNKDSYINIQSYIENSKTVLEISDNGIGIDMQKNKDKIFGMYKTFNNNPDAKGMGLFVTKNQIDAMGGSITVESQLHEGTSFKIYFK
ncbi:PAS domain S-box-containing protein [Flavobacterium arsenatis]|uniref:histidine kinase n=1 Tax=Flavobacterium arsenatis TaxID=1484332 RepID=A0ABU1TU17_9FLAO|nr:PAS domain S-box protein [Flavobacterium arsenatis]MDR6969317.1 PAS domain S-box-containing protein [Flavobacterium arsenatis]